MGRRNSLVAALVVAGALMVGASAQASISFQVYDNFNKPGYSLTDYGQKWANRFGLGEEGPTVRPDNRNFSGGRFNLSAVPFKTGSDVSVFDHLKYIAVSSKLFPVPRSGTLVMSSDIKAATPGTVNGLAQQGVYGPSGTWLDPAAPPFPPNYHALARQGQQAGVVMNARSTSAPVSCLTGSSPGTQRSR
jgi:hypothetical protein